MFPDGLDQLLPTLLLALAVGCGVPALIYLAFHGNLREKPKPEKAEPKKPTKEELSKVVGYMDAYEHVPVPVKGYIYVPIDFLEEALKRTGYVPAQTEKQKPQEVASKPSGHPLIKRVGE
ncbi:MAG: hypothetical protein ACPLZY_02145 [Candidatus Norongarragalinales archaeon]